MTSADAFSPDLDEQADNLPRAQHSSRGRGAVIAFSMVTAVLLLSPVSRVLLYGFPLMAFLLAIYLYRRNRASYVSLVCWLFFLTPLVRRLVDYRVGFGAPASVLLAPPLALCAPAAWLITGWRKILQPPRATPLLCILATCIYATFLGILNFAPRLVFQDLLGWLAPLIFAFTLVRHSDQAVEMFQAFEKAFVYGLLVISAYGLVQFFFLPRWDALWMESVLMESIGLAEPTQVRVFSTMNAPQVLASFLAVGLLIALNSRSKIRFVSIPLGLLCLMLSLARSGWVAAVAGALYLLFSLPQRQRVQLLLAAILSAVVLIFALQNPDLQQTASQRFQSLSDVRGDDSFIDRMDAYKSLFDGFLRYPFGLGMGATPAVAESVTQVVVRGGWNQDLGDSSVALVITTLGLAGGLVLVCSVLPLGWRLFRETSVDAHCTRTMRAILIALLSESVLDGVVTGPTGFLTWAGVGFCIALAISSDGSHPALEPAGVTA
jgi:O-Antigen ligase